MKFLKNTWYVAAWADEVGRDPVQRKILNEEIVMYRKENGEPVAIGGICPHRFAPLAMGKLQGDTIECPYHGLRFDGSGACVHNPLGDGKIPPRAKVANYAVVERHNLVWLWGGDADQADPSTIPVLGYLDDKARKTVTGCLHVGANYQLYVDNLVDLTHAQFVHSDQLGVDNFEDATIDVVENSDKVSATITIEETAPPPALKDLAGIEVADGDFVLISNWEAPSIVTNNIKFLDKASKDAYYESFGTHILTPETETTAHYFYGLTRQFKVDDPEVDAGVRAWHLKGFQEEDKPIIEAAARMMGDETDPLAMGAVYIPNDGANVRVRRILERRIAEEQAQLEDA